MGLFTKWYLGYIFLENPGQIYILWKSTRFELWCSAFGSYGEALKSSEAEFICYQPNGQQMIEREPNVY